MTLRPWIKFYPSDWRADQALRVCSLAARGLWIECMCIMHEATPYGHLLVNGRPPTDAQLAALAGTQLDQIPGLLDELESAGVSSRTRSGVIYSRRMTRDEKRRNDGEKAQKTGGKLPNSRRSQRSEKKQEKLPPQEVTGGVTERPPSTQKPEARSNPPNPLAGAMPKDLADEIWEMAGQNPDHVRVRGFTEDISLVAAWLKTDDADDIRAAARAIIARSGQIRSLWRLLQTAMPDELAKQRPEKPPQMSDDDRWRSRMQAWQRSRALWQPDWDDPPDSPRTKVPKHILAEFGVKAAA